MQARAEETKRTMCPCVPEAVEEEEEKPIGRTIRG